MANLDLSKYGITGTVEVLHNPSYDVLFQEETKAGLEGFEKGQVDRKSTRLNSSHSQQSRMPSSA